MVTELMAADLLCLTDSLLRYLMIYFAASFRHSVSHSMFLTCSGFLNVLSFCLLIRIFSFYFSLTFSCKVWNLFSSYFFLFTSLVSFYLAFMRQGSPTTSSILRGLALLRLQILIWRIFLGFEDELIVYYGLNAGKIASPRHTSSLFREVIFLMRFLTKLLIYALNVVLSSSSASPMLLQRQLLLVLPRKVVFGR